MEKTRGNSNSNNNNINHNGNNNNDGLLLSGGAVIRKGPWKPEEDQVLLSHVQKYGPRDWSSIRSKGLLHRTGKSCRLRWVNKLRPNLKNGCKFTAEEERIVIELQSQLGNKWATIATHLPGRTDNDVKNFWSSRQKRLARILLNNQSPTHQKSHKSAAVASSSAAAGDTNSHKRQRVVSHEASGGSFATEEGEPSTKRQCRTSSASYTSADTDNDVKMVAPIATSTNLIPQAYVEPNLLEPIPLNISYPTNNNEVQPQETPNFHSFPLMNLPTDFMPFPPETQELIDRLDVGFLEPFGCTTEPLLDDGYSLFSCFRDGPKPGSLSGTTDNTAAPDSFFDDFPPEIFDEIEPLPSPSRW